MSNFYTQLPKSSVGSVSISGPVTVSNEVEIKNDIGNPVPIDAVNLDIRDLSFAQDKVDVSGSTIIIGQNPVVNYFNEITAVAAGLYTIVLTKNVTSSSLLKFASSSSNNIAEYEVVLNGSVLDKKRSNFGTSLNCDFNFVNGITLVNGDILVLRARHDRPSAADINAKFIIEE